MSMPATDSLTRTTAPMAAVDGCPECVANVEPPLSHIVLELGYRCAYLCSDCGHAWTTDWRN